MIGWTIGGRVTQKASARKVTHMTSTIAALTCLILEVRGIWVKGLGISHPFNNEHNWEGLCNKIIRKIVFNLTSTTFASQIHFSLTWNDNFCD